jgi:hypothetical protein
MGQKCSTLGAKKEEEEDDDEAERDCWEEEEEEEGEEEEEKKTALRSKTSSFFLEVRRDFLEFSKAPAAMSSPEEEKRRERSARAGGNAREERAPEGGEEDSGEMSPRVVGNVSLVHREEEKRGYRWTVGEKQLREATTKGNGAVMSTVFQADESHAFRLALENSVEVEDRAAKAFVSARLECCSASSSNTSNLVDVAATMRVLLEFTRDEDDMDDDENKSSLLLREAYTRQVLKTDQSESLVLRDFFKTNIAENNASKHTTTKQKATTKSIQDRFQLVFEVEFDALDAVASERDDESDIDIFNSSAIVAYCVSLSPLLFVFENFLHKSECEFLRTLAEKDLKRSRVTDGKLSNGRTSSSCFLVGAKGKEDVVKTIESRMLDIIRKTPIVTTRRFDTQKLKGSEPMQIVKYAKNEKYTSHFDNKAGSFRRVATFMCYLNDECEGGCTNFPKAEPLFAEPSFDAQGAFKPFVRKKKFVASEQQRGIKIHPKLGRAILFFSISEKPFRENPLSLHEGQTVNKGEKYISTKWLTRTEESENNEEDFVSSDEADAD